MILSAVKTNHAAWYHTPEVKKKALVIRRYDRWKPGGLVRKHHPET